MIKVVLHFLPKYLAYLMIFQSFATPSARSTVKITPKIWQKLKKSLVQIALNPLINGTTETRVSGTQSVATDNTYGLYIRIPLKITSKQINVNWIATLRKLLQKRKKLYVFLKALKNLSSFDKKGLIWLWRTENPIKSINSINFLFYRLIKNPDYNIISC